MHKMRTAVKTVAREARHAPMRVAIAVLEPVLATSGALLVAWLVTSLFIKARDLFS